MSKRLLSVDCSSNKTTNQYAVYRREEPKTFSSLIDKVVSELPVPILSKHPNNTRSMDPNNPLYVLQDKGPLTISPRARNYFSDYDVSFYAEESQLGETVKVFSSNHHFREGKLVCSSTQELFPELPYDAEKLEEWRRTKGPKAITYNKTQPQVQSETIHHSSSRRKLVDMLQDVERQNVIRRYESAARKGYCRSASPATDTCRTKDERSERYLHALRSQNTRRKTTPFSIQKIPNSSPDRYKYRVAYIESKPLKISSCKPVQLRPLSELSIASVESHVCSSPGMTVEENKRYSMKYRRTPPRPPKTKNKNDLFVIPQHICHKVPHRKLQHSSRKAELYWDTVQSFVESPELKHYAHQHKTSERSHYETAHSTPTVPFRESEHQKFVETSTRDSRRRGEHHQRPDVSGQEWKYQEISPKHILYRKSSSPTSARIEEKYNVHDKTAHSGERQEEQHRHHKVRHQIKENCADEHVRHQRDPDEVPKVHGKLKHVIHQEIPMGETFEEKYKRWDKASEVKSDSESSGQTLPFSPSDSESEKGVKREQDKSSDSETSICPTFYGDSRSPASESYRKSTQHHQRDHRKGYHKEHEEHIHEQSEQSEASTETELRKHTKRSEERKVTGQEKFTDGKQVKTKRMINPSKTVHFEESGRRLNQHYSAGKATMDSKKAFEQEGKVRSKKINNCTHSPVSSMTSYAKLHQKNGDYHETRVAKESIVNPSGKKFRVNSPGLIIDNLVNEGALREYRVKYVDPNKNITRNTAEMEHEEYKAAIKRNKEMSRSVRSRHQDECEACKIETLLDINN